MTSLYCSVMSHSRRSCLDSSTSSSLSFFAVLCLLRVADAIEDFYSCFDSCWLVDLNLHLCFRLYLTCSILLDGGLTAFTVDLRSWWWLMCSGWPAFLPFWLYLSLQVETSGLYMSVDCEGFDGAYWYSSVKVLSDWCWWHHSSSRHSYWG